MSFVLTLKLDILMEPSAKRVKYETPQRASERTFDGLRPSVKASRSIAETKRTIALLPAEQLLRELLLECAQFFPGLEIWVAGGWVRDRLLGIPSSDLDLALSNLTGKEFGTFLEEFSARPEVASRYSGRAAELGITGDLFTRFHVAKKNPKMPKQLETAGGKLFGLDIDLVNLRKEVYDGQSRNPDMEFGTTAEDAFRRDAAVNALFFHLARQEVVDPTGRGLEDLGAGIMRTPLDPRKTFMDDPLRVLRLIRIGSKLGFTIDPEAVACMQDTKIHDALDTMITRDRVGAELVKMMRDKKPEIAFRRIFEFHLYAPVLIRCHATILEPLLIEFPFLRRGSSSAWPTTWPRAYEMLAHILGQSDDLARLVGSEKNPEVLWTMVAYTPFAGLRRSLLEDVIQEASSAIRTPSKISQLLESSLTHFDSICDTVDAVARQGPSYASRSACGMAIRSWGPAWTTQLTYVILAQAVYHRGEGIALVSSPESLASEQGIRDRLLDKYSKFANFIHAQSLRDAHSLRPILNGAEVQHLFGLKEGGKYLKLVMDALIEWQFDHADASKEEAEAWLMSNKEKLEVAVQIKIVD